MLFVPTFVLLKPLTVVVPLELSEEREKLGREMRLFSSWHSRKFFHDGGRKVKTAPR